MGKIQGPGGGEKFNLSLISKHFVPVFHGDKRVQLIIYEAKTESGWFMSGFVIGEQGGLLSYPGHMRKDGSCIK